MKRLPAPRPSREHLGTLIALAVLVLVFGISTRHFFGATNLLTIANQIPASVLVATGMTYILILGQIDLSVGSVFALSGAVLGITLHQGHWPLPAAAAAALAAGSACGAFNSVVSLHWRLPTFIVTLGTLEMARGGAHAITGSQTLYLGSAVEGITDARLFGLSIPFLLAVSLVVAGQIILTRTVFGRHVIAIGTNPEAARLAGIHLRLIQVTVFLVTGLLVGLAAVIDTSRFQSANPNAGHGLELQTIAAAVIGGTSLMGGRGSVVGTFLGVLIMAVLNSGLAAVGAREELKRLITGAVIIAAVIADVYRHRRPRES